MAKPRVFVSSTYYDLKHIRNSVEAFIENLGYDAVLFESGNIPFHHDAPLDESCYSEIQNCHMLVLIIGGRYGSPSSDSKALSPKDNEKAYKLYNSVTKKEYETACDRDIPVFIFVEKNVLAEFQTYKNNRNNDSIIYHHVDSVNIYKLLDDILAQRRNNFIKDFEKFDDISTWLRDQWAGLFADFLAQKSAETSLKDLSSQIASLGQVSNVLKTYTETIMRKIQPEDSETIISRQEKQLQASKIRNFGFEDMVDHLLRKGKPSSTPDKIYKAFEDSTNLDDFLKKAKFNKKYISEFMLEFESKAKRDYNKLMNRYFRQRELEIED